MLTNDVDRDGPENVDGGSNEGETTGVGPYPAAQMLLRRLETNGTSFADRRTAVSGLVHLLLSGAINPSVFDHLKKEMTQYLAQARELFGVPSSVSKRVSQFLDSRPQDEEFSIITHREPDLDGASAAIQLRALLRARGHKAVIHSGDGSIDALLAQLPESAKLLSLRGVQDVDPQSCILLVDANDPHAPHVGLAHGFDPSLIIDTHFPSQEQAQSATEAIILEDHTAAVTVVVGALLPILPSEAREGFLWSKQWSKLATWAFLGMVSDSANVRRAGPHDVEAIYKLLPFIDENLLEEYRAAPFQKHVKAFVQKGRKELVNNGRGLATHLGKATLKARHSAAASSDRLMNGSKASMIMVSYQVGNDLHVSLRVHPESELVDTLNIKGLAKDVIGQNSGGRKGGVAGGRVKADLFGSTEATVEALQRLFFQKVSQLN